MKKETLQNIIVSQKETFVAKNYLVVRPIVEREEKKLLSKEVVFITGIRRSGKSSLIYLIYKHLSKKNKIPLANVLFVNFEDERFTDFDVYDFDLLYQTFRELDNPKGKMYLFFDEIQNINGWERFINRLYEFEDVKIFITGSNASLINSDIATALTSRNRQIVNYTFSLHEYAVLQKIELVPEMLYSDTKKLEANRLLNNYIARGGFPEVLKTDDVQIVDQYFKDTMYRDIIAKYNIRNIKEIKELALYLITNTGNLNSYDKLRKILGANNTSTIKNYLAVFQDVFLIYALPLFDFSIKKQIYNPNKYYVTDIGFYYAVGFSFSPDKGRLLENLVLLDLLRNEHDVFYWKSAKGYEVDFLIYKKHQITVALQVCYYLTNENKDREIRGLMAAASELKAHELIVVTYQQDDTLQIDGVVIKTISYLKWVLNQ